MSKPTNDLALFEQYTLRRVWYKEDWYYSIIDIIAILSESPSPRTYWAKLKDNLADEGSHATLDAIVVLKLKAADNRFRQTDTGNRETILRIIQSVPSPRAESFKQWLAEVGSERIAEIENPERAIERVRQTYRDRGYTEEWIEQRIRSDLIRNELTDEWRARGAQDGREYAILTNEISSGTFSITIQAHKEYKLLPKAANLRDHMNGIELALLSLGEATATKLHQNRDSQGFGELHRDANDAGRAAGRARQEIEAATGEAAVSTENHLALAKRQSSTKTKKRTTTPTTDATAHQGSLFDTPNEPE